MHHEHADHALGCAGPDSLVLVNSTVVADRSFRGRGTVIAVPATDLALELGHSWRPPWSCSGPTRR